MNHSGSGKPLESTVKPNVTLYGINLQAELLYGNLSGEILILV